MKSLFAYRYAPLFALGITLVSIPALGTELTPMLVDDYGDLIVADYSVLLFSAQG